MPSPLGRVAPKGPGEVRYGAASYAALRRKRSAVTSSDLALLGHLKVNCPVGAREATLGCPQRGRLYFFFSSFQNSLLNSTRWAMSSTQPQVMKQSATLKTGKRMNSTSIMSTT